MKSLFFRFLPEVLFYLYARKRARFSSVAYDGFGGFDGRDPTPPERGDPSSAGAT
jgi:hypothetical protein